MLHAVASIVHARIAMYGTSLVIISLVVRDCGPGHIADLTSLIFENKIAHSGVCTFGQRMGGGSSVTSLMALRYRPPSAAVPESGIRSAAAGHFSLHLTDVQTKLVIGFLKRQALSSQLSRACVQSCRLNASFAWWTAAG